MKKDLNKIIFNNDDETTSSDTTISFIDDKAEEALDYIRQNPNKFTLLVNHSFIDRTPDSEQLAYIRFHILPKTGEDTKGITFYASGATNFRVREISTSEVKNIDELKSKFTSGLVPTDNS